MWRLTQAALCSQLRISWYAGADLARPVLSEVRHTCILTLMTHQQGTQIKVFDTSTGRLIQLFLRGATRVRVWSICFSHDSRLLAATSTHAHCHVFRLNDAALVRTTMWGVTSPRLVRPSVLGRRHASPRQPPLPATRGASGPAASGVAAAAAAGAGCSSDATAPPALTHVHHGSGSDDDEPHPGATAAASEVGDPAGDATGSTTAPPAASSSVVASHTHPSGPPRVPPQQHVVRGPKARRSSFISGLFKSRASGERAVVKCSVPANSKSVCSFGPHAGTVYPLIGTLGDVGAVSRGWSPAAAAHVVVVRYCSCLRRRFCESLPRERVGRSSIFSSCCGVGREVFGQELACACLCPPPPPPPPLRTSVSHWSMESEIVL